MDSPEFVFVAGCNAAGKSSFIRSRIDNLDDFAIIMTDVYKHRSKDLVREAIYKKQDIILETVFNDESFKDLIDEAVNAGYHTSLIVLFLDNPQESLKRVSARSLQQNGLTFSGNNVKLNFNLSFTNVCYYFFYFDRADFVYTGIVDQNIPILHFEKSKLTRYWKNDLMFPQRFAEFAFGRQRMTQETYDIIRQNKDYDIDHRTPDISEEEKSSRRFKR